MYFCVLNKSHSDIYVLASSNEKPKKQNKKQTLSAKTQAVKVIHTKTPDINFVKA